MSFLQWLKEDFLGYLDEWEVSVSSREGVFQGREGLYTLSKEMVEGLRLRGILPYKTSIVHVITDVKLFLYTVKHATC